MILRIIGHMKCYYLLSSLLEIIKSFTVMFRIISPLLFWRIFIKAKSLYQTLQTTYGTE